MRARAHVEPLALAIDRDLLVGGNLRDPLGLEALAVVAEILDQPLVAVQISRSIFSSRSTISRIAGLDLREVLGRERLVAGEIVIEAVLDRRAEGDLRAGIELLHRLGQHMGAVVAQQLERVGVILGDDLDPWRRCSIGRGQDPSALPSTLTASAALARPGPMACGQFRARDRALERTAAAVRQRHGNHRVRGKFMSGEGI